MPDPAAVGSCFRRNDERWVRMTVRGKWGEGTHLRTIGGGGRDKMDSRLRGRREGWWRVIDTYALFCWNKGQVRVGNLG